LSKEGIGAGWRAWNERAPELSATEECRHISRKRKFGFQAGLFEMLFGKGRWISAGAGLHGSDFFALPLPVALSARSTFF
jgi:hypothetical protein